MIRFMDTIHIIGNISARLFDLAFHNKLIINIYVHFFGIETHSVRRLSFIYYVMQTQNCIVLCERLLLFFLLCN